VHAASGYELANLRYQDNPQQPLKSAMFIADYLTGVHAFGAVNAALVRRARTGQGETIDCALMDSMIGMLAYECARRSSRCAGRGRSSARRAALDGFVILAPISPANFADLARAIGRPEWLTDPRFITSEARAENWDALMGELDALGRRQDRCRMRSDHGARRRAVLALLHGGRGDGAAVCERRGLLATTQGRRRRGQGAERAVPHAERQVGARDFVAALGEHNERVLRECLGLIARQGRSARRARNSARRATEAGVAQ
jgi:crotonobetainyl-CoA:carnitine CoA-transferase CaiB-like acyl-CoA transferase